MPKLIPIYRDQDETYQADTCLPVVEAAAKHQIRWEALAQGHYPGRKLPAGALDGVKSVGFWHAEQDQDWGLPWHRNEGIEITLLESGSLGFAVEEREFCLHADDLTVTKPWQRHRVGTPTVGAGRLHWVILDLGVRRPNQNWKWPNWLVLSEPDREGLTNILRHMEQPVWKASPEVRHCFQTIAQTIAAVDEGSGISRLTVRLNELFLLLLEMFRRQHVPLDESLSGTGHTVELFLQDLRAHPEHLELEWTVENMAKSCGLGTTRFIYHVKRLTNMSPMHYLNHLRLDRAAGMLQRDSRVSVTDIAVACGFSSGQYFATVFNRRFGCSPREFRAYRLTEEMNEAQRKRKRLPFAKYDSGRPGRSSVRI